MSPEMFVMMTGKQTKPEGSPGVKRLHLQVCKNSCVSVNYLIQTREMKVWMNAAAGERIWQQYLFSFSLVMWTILCKVAQAFP